jgi:putative two-component system response regulator
VNSFDLPGGDRILIVDDEPANVVFLREVLAEAGYTSLRDTGDPLAVDTIVGEWEPDLILLDIHMPGMDGYEVLESIRRRFPEVFLPVLVLTADETITARRRALAVGATDFLAKPLDIVEVRLRVRNLLHSRRLHLALLDEQRLLERRVADRTEELAASQREIIARLALAAEFRDDTTGRHTQRVGDLSAEIGRNLGIDEMELEIIRLATPLHDIGKIGIPDHILLKPGPLTEAEYAEVQQHVTIGASILSGGTAPLLKLAEEVALTHHERWDGTGYLGLAGEDIPLVARIVAVADVFDALSSVRPYKEAWPRDRVIEEIQALSGLHFDPRIVAAFLEAISE